ncbi:hydantoinase/carbamoylase family amidase [Burkholderia pseudomallei]|uniref:Zn-dependent hydrolase n=1 Tax=Burkholderia pseudomallei TaxID=28450 RepID=UPI00132C070F|nr:Zn-dependent hydrolase [Burkholderia pseudomallei]MVZ84040.1 hydantoinase/carbamoylase family amidase [Burkholderia pseudomallei]
MMASALGGRTLAIDGERLWRSLMEMARIGGTAHGGVRRLAATDDDRRGRDRFAQWCREAGLALSVDEIGNLFARRAGAEAGAPPVLIGSHLDTQPEGGRFDGTYGVLAALEVVRSLNDAGIVTRKPIEIVSWTNEEGARFAPAMLGSAVAAGVMPLAQALAGRDAAGVTLGDALERIGYRGARRAVRPAIDAYFEAHIEQGPVLEANGVEIGVVTGGQAIRWLDVTIAGQPAHAGTTPVAHRRDALFGFAQIADAIERMLAEFAPHGLATIGCVEIPNASRNTIAGAVAFTLDLRHPDDATLDAMARAATDACARIAARRGLRADVSTHWASPSTRFDAACIASVEAAAARFGYRHERVVSGAGHDAIHLAKHGPGVMVFIPCVGGLSHNEAEAVLPADATRGANVLLGAVLDRAGRAAR